MIKKVSDYKKAFTLAEILIAFAIVGVLCTLTAFSVFNSDEKNKAEISLSSQNFYNTVAPVFVKVTSPFEATPFNITSGNSSDLLKNMLAYMDFSSSNLDCKNVNFDSFKADNCAKLNTGIKMGVKVDNSCNSELNVYEYLQSSDKDLAVSSIETRKVTGACGYVIFRTKNSKGIFKKDAFVIPLGKTRLK